MPASTMARCTTLDVGVDVDAERGEDIGGAGLGGEGAVAVLGHRHAAAGDDERRGGRDVEGAGAVAAGADGVDGAGGRRRSAAALARMVRAAPVISSTVSPRTRSAIRKPPICAGVASPDIMRVEGRAGFVLAQPLAGGELREQRLEIAGRLAHAATLLRRGETQEIAQQIVAALRRDALGMELHAVQRPLAMRDAHDDAVLGLGGDARAPAAGRRARRSASDSASPRRDWAGRRRRRLPCGGCGSACRASAPARARRGRPSPGRSPDGRGRRRAPARCRRAAPDRGRCRHGRGRSAPAR